MRLVVHIGGMRTACSAVQRGLAANLKPLRASGVTVPTAGRASVGGDRVAHDLLAPLSAGDEAAASAAWRELIEEISAAPQDTAVVTSALLAITAAEPATRKTLDAALNGVRDAGIDVTVLYVVRDQLTQLNGWYVDRVAALVETHTFAVFSHQAVRSGELNLHRVFHPWYAGPPRFVALPYPSLVSGDPLTNLLKAADVDVPAERLRPTGLKNPPLLGPLGVEAVRLLGHHLRSIDPAFDPGSSLARQIADLALERAAAAGWAGGGYWGWSPTQARQVAHRLQGPNRTFAKAVWDSDWPLTMPVEREATAVPLLRAPVSELTEIQRFASTLVRNYLEIRSGVRPTEPKPAAEPAQQGAVTGTSDKPVRAGGGGGGGGQRAGGGRRKRAARQRAGKPAGAGGNAAGRRQRRGGRATP